MDCEILPQAYTLYKKDRDTQGDGVMQAISSNLSSRQIPSPGNLELAYVSSFFSVILMSSSAPPPLTMLSYSDLSNYLANYTYCLSLMT